MCSGFALLQHGAVFSASQDTQFSVPIRPAQGVLLVGFCLTLGLVYPTSWWWWWSGNRDLQLAVGALME